MDDSEPAGYPASLRAHRAAPAEEDGDRAGGHAFMPTASMTLRLDRDQPAGEAGGAPGVTAQWALWGKDGGDPAYRVLRCSEGTFGPGVFHGIISRYASGVKERLPQYTVCWIPPSRAGRGYRAPGNPAGRAPGDGDGAVGANGEASDQGYLAAGIHEVGSGGRPQTAGGREIEYIRLFCVRYLDLAVSGVRYADLVDAVREQQLPAGLTAPVPVDLPQTPPRLLPAPFDALAEDVATLLLTTRPVCVLGAEADTAEQRLLFIDQVMALLPYGLRATLSASTWASPTAQDLKLRLFFSSARRDDGGWTSYVTWGQPGHLGRPAGQDEAPWLYLDWLRHLGSQRAAPALLGERRPVRFKPAEIRRMVARLPQDRPVEESLRELANNLRQRDKDAVAEVVARLRSYLAGQVAPVQREAYQRLITRLGLLKDHPGVHPATKASVYRVLLSLAFEVPLSYAGYRGVEDCAGGPPRGTLRSVMLKLKYASFLPWLLVAQADPKVTDEELVETLAEEGLPATSPITALMREFDGMRPAHRGVLYDLGVRYLCAYAENPRAELIRRGYLAGTLEAVFPDDHEAQRGRLVRTLLTVHGGLLGKSQIRELFADPNVRPTMALEAAVGRLAPPRARRFIAEQAGLARLRYGIYADGAPAQGRIARWRSRRPEPDTMLAVPKKTVYGLAVLFVLVVGVVLVVATHM